MMEGELPKMQNSLFMIEWRRTTKHSLMSNSRYQESERGRIHEHIHDYNHLVYVLSGRFC